MATAGCTRRVPPERAVCKHRYRKTVVHPAPIPSGRVPDKHTVAQRWAASIVKHPAALRVRILIGGTIGISGGDCEAVKHGCLIGFAAGHHVVAVFSSAWVAEQVKRILNIHIVAGKVTAEDGFICVDISGIRVEGGCAGVATFNSHAIF
ncbi:hypothetical protein ES703_114842 [subsurface metagenome]